jgi:hypothetical protein
MVVTEDLGEATPSHHVHGDTVREARVFVGSLFRARETLEARFMGLREHGDAWVGEDAPDHMDGALP